MNKRMDMRYSEGIAINMTNSSESCTWIGKLELRLIKEWICAIVKVLLCKGSQICPKCDITRRQRPMSTRNIYITEKLARHHVQNATFGLSAAG